MFYLELFKAFNDAGAQYVLVGGVALNLHGVERATMDVDLAIALDPANLARSVDALRALEMQPVAPVSWEDFLRSGQLDQWFREKGMLAFGVRKSRGYSPTVDLLVRPRVAFDLLHAHSDRRDVGGIEVRIASIDDLIALKTGTGREIDAADIAALESVRRMKGASR